LALSLYDVSVPVLTRGLGVLSSYLDKAEAYAREKGIDPTTIIGARLFPDMYPLSGQIQRASDTSKAAMGRLTGVEMPSFPDTEQTFDDLRARIAKTVAFLHSVDRKAFEGSENRKVEMKFGSGPVVLSAEAFALSFMLPNFFFHVTTAHDILRHSGVPVGKRDYLGSFEGA
jgi:uncharacterized protein